MQIPFTVAARPDTGLHNAKLGVWLFLASEVMLFGALFSSYILLRVAAPEWPHGSALLNVPLATVNTIILISSSVTMVMSWASLMLKDFSKYKLPILIAENGICTAQDSQRSEFIMDHLRQLARAMKWGAPVMGYLYWSLLDNYEWADGFERFRRIRDPST